MPDLPSEPPPVVQYPRPQPEPRIDLWFPSNVALIYKTQLGPQIAIGTGATLISSGVFLWCLFASIPWAAATDDNVVSFERISIATLPATCFAISVFTYALGSLTIINVGAMRGQRITMGNVLTYCGRLGNGVIFALVVGLLISIGYFTIVIPGLIVGGLTMLAPPIMAFGRRNAYQALGDSIRALRPHFWAATLAYLLYTTYGCVGLLACGIGIVASLPLASIPMAALYNRLFPADDQA